MMFLRTQRYPSSDSAIIVCLDGLVATWNGLVVDRDRPATAVKRMLSVRNDSGPQDYLLSRRSYGVNAYAETRALAEDLALDAMAVLRPLHTRPVSSTSNFAGPFEIEPTEDEPPVQVGKFTLGHFYFTFTASVRPA